MSLSTDDDKKQDKVTMNTKSLEKEFMESLKKNTLIIQVGCRHSGKTTWAMSLLRHLLLNDNFYGEYHLILPTYESGQTGGTFDWLDLLPQKTQEKITIYCEFSLVIVENLIQDSDGKTNRFLYCDDATSEVQLFSNDSTLKSLSSKARHYKITTFLCFHFLKRTLSTQLRNSAEWIILHRATDMKLLEGIWEECCSLFHDKKPFMEMVRDEMFKDYPSVIIWRDRGYLDCGNGMEWKIQIKNRESVLNPKKHSNSILDNDTKKSSSATDTEPKDIPHRRSKSTVQKSTSRKVPTKNGGRKHSDIRTIGSYINKRFQRSYNSCW